MEVRGGQIVLCTQCFKGVGRVEEGMWVVYKEGKWVCLREACLGAVEVREVGGIDSVGQHGRLCGQQLPVPSTCALHIMYVTMEPAYECTVWTV